MTTMMKTYSSMIQLQTFEERFRYLKLNGKVGEITFGHSRYANQKFYNSHEWKTIRNQIIVRDMGCDLGVEGYEIVGTIYVHHIIPITEKDIVDGSYKLIDPENLICVSHETHMALHYGDEGRLLPVKPIERKRGDTKLW